MHAAKNGNIVQRDGEGTEGGGAARAARYQAEPGNEKDEPGNEGDAWERGRCLGARDRRDRVTGG